MRRFISTAWLFLVAAPTVQAAELPAIVQIRHNYNLINQKISQAAYRAQSKEIRLCGDSVTSYTRWLDERGVTRRLTERASGDALATSSELLTSLWFDAAGRLDFALVQATDDEYDVHTDANGRVVNNGLKSRNNTVEMRVYFDNSGQVIRTLNRSPMTSAETNYHMAGIRKLARLRWSDLKNECK